MKRMNHESLPHNNSKLHCIICALAQNYQAEGINYIQDLYIVWSLHVCTCMVSAFHLMTLSSHLMTPIKKSLQHTIQKHHLSTVGDQFFVNLEFTILFHWEVHKVRVVTTLPQHHPYAGHPDPHYGGLDDRRATGRR